MKKIIMLMALCSISAWAVLQSKGQVVGPSDQNVTSTYDSVTSKRFLDVKVASSESLEVSIASGSSVVIDDSTPVDVAVTSGGGGSASEVTTAVNASTAFMASELVTLSSGTANRWRLVVGANPVNLIFRLSAEGQASLVLTGEATVSTSGSGLAELNRDRTSVATTTVTTFTGSAFTGGTTLLNSVVGGGNSYIIHETAKLVLKASSEYYFTVTDISAADNDVAIELVWWE